jgi:putative transposase
MLKAVKVRLYPNREQKQRISSQIGGARYVYNRALALRKYAYTKFGLKIGKFALINHIKKLKSREKTSWLKEVDSQAIQQSIANMDRAYQYHATILLDMPEHEVVAGHNSKSVGLDVGVSLVVADSNGKKVKPLELTRELYKLRKKAKQLSRKKKGSNNRAKAKAKLAKANLKIANKRKDFLHKLSFQYAENQGIVVVEDLKIKNMTKSAKGTVETPGRQVKQKQGLNRSITQQSWGMFFELLEYKLHQRGGQLIKVDPKHTS